MTMVGDLWLRCRSIALPALGACVLAYFAYHTVQGDRGLLSYMRLSNEVAQAQSALDELRTAREGLEHRVGLLDRRHLDLDMLEERLRLDLHKLRPGEVIVFLPAQS